MLTHTPNAADLDRAVEEYFVDGVDTTVEGAFRDGYLLGYRAAPADYPASDPDSRVVDVAAYAYFSAEPQTTVEGVMRDGYVCGYIAMVTRARAEALAFVQGDEVTRVIGEFRDCVRWEADGDVVRAPVADLRVAFRALAVARQLLALGEDTRSEVTK